MLLARFLSKMLKSGGIVLIDSEGQKYICGNPESRPEPRRIKHSEQKRESASPTPIHRYPPNERPPPFLLLLPPPPLPRAPRRDRTKVAIAQCKRLTIVPSPCAVLDRKRKKKKTALTLLSSIQTSQANKDSRDLPPRQHRPKRRGSVTKYSLESAVLFPTQ